MYNVRTVLCSAHYKMAHQPLRVLIKHYGERAVVFFQDITGMLYVMALVLLVIAFCSSSLVVNNIKL